MPVKVNDSQDAMLAINGARPIRDRMLPYGHQSITEEDIQAVVNVLRSDWITTGPYVERFERAFAKQVCVREAVAFSSGTAALHGAMFAAGLCAGDEAITSPLTFCATANAVLYQQAQVVFADVKPTTLTLDPLEIEKRLTPRTKAIIPMDYSGHPADLDAILTIAQRHHAVVIEDAAHALGATYRNRPIGSISHMTVFSFHPVKHITTGEGGMVTTDDPTFARRLRLFRNHGIEAQETQRALQGPWYREMVELGYNYRLSDIGCALGLSQLGRLDENLTQRRSIAEEYQRAFRDIPGLILPYLEAHVRSAWHLYPICVKPQTLRVGRKEVFCALRAENIGVNVHHIPVHLHPYYRKRFGYQEGDYPIAEHAYQQLISLPMFHGMTNQDVHDVVEAVRKVFTHYASHE